MIAAVRIARKIAALLALAGLGARSSHAVAQQTAAHQTAAPPTKVQPADTYWVYAGAESADLIHRLRLGPQGLTVEKTMGVGEQPSEMEGPHGLAISADGKSLYMTTGHGVPGGKFWHFALGPDTLTGPGRGTFLGQFPASIDVTPDGLYTISANFNLHGDMVPSSLSVVYTPTNTEVARIVTCVMPHGSRISPDGLRHYSTCMMDEQVVEVDTRNFAVSRRFRLAKGQEGPLPVNLAPDRGPSDSSKSEPGHAEHGGDAAASPDATKPPVDPAEAGYASSGGKPHQMAAPTCSPTWAQPSSDGTKIFVACNKADEIVEIDRDRWEITRRLRTGRGPYNLAVTPDGKLLIATLKQGAMVEMFDVASGQSLKQLPTSATLAHGVAVTPDSRYAFTTSEGVGSAPGKVDVYDLRTLSHVASADVGQQASGIAFWKMSHE